ncbi:hypothetical protein BDW66DRAFT_147595 [Aspergillus desertorum]
MGGILLPAKYPSSTTKSAAATTRNIWGLSVSDLACDFGCYARKASTRRKPDSRDKYLSPAISKQGGARFAAQMQAAQPLEFRIADCCKPLPVSEQLRRRLRLWFLSYTSHRRNTVRNVVRYLHALEARGSMYQDHPPISTGSRHPAAKAKTTT